MKIEVDIDDAFYPALRKIFPEPLNIGILISKTLEGMIVLFAAYPDEFIYTFGHTPGEGEFAEHADRILKRVMEKSKAEE